MRKTETGNHYVIVRTSSPMGVDELDAFYRHKNLELINETVIPNALVRGKSIGNVWRYVFKKYFRSA